MHLSRKKNNISKKMEQNLLIFCLCSLSWVHILKSNSNSSLFSNVYSQCTIALALFFFLAKLLIFRKFIASVRAPLISFISLFRAKKALGLVDNGFSYVAAVQIKNNNKFIAIITIVRAPLMSFISLFRAKSILGWEPRVPLDKGLAKTIDYFKRELKRSKHSERNQPHPNEYLVYESEPWTHNYCRWKGVCGKVYMKRRIHIKASKNVQESCIHENYVVLRKLHCNFLSIYYIRC